jgi:hypothetical protein
VKTFEVANQKKRCFLVYPAVVRVYRCMTGAHKLCEACDKCCERLHIEGMEVSGHQDMHENRFQ